MLKPTYACDGQIVRLVARRPFTYTFTLSPHPDHDHSVDIKQTLKITT